jgi:RNA polymerase sigma-70 factor (ECF subfamily)
VQEALLTAANIIQEFAQERPVAFYPWLRRITWERMVDMQRQHLDAKRRAVLREVQPRGSFSEASRCELARKLVRDGPAPSRAIHDQEAREQLARALEQLEPGQREVILLRYLEQLSLADTAGVLNITPDAVKMRQLRAIRRLREILEQAADR